MKTRIISRLVAERFKITIQGDGRFLPSTPRDLPSRGKPPHLLKDDCCDIVPPGLKPVELPATRYRQSERWAIL